MLIGFLHNSNKTVDKISFILKYNGSFAIIICTLIVDNLIDMPIYTHHVDKVVNKIPFMLSFLSHHLVDTMNHLQIFLFFYIIPQFFYVYYCS